MWAIEGLEPVLRVQGAVACRSCWKSWGAVTPATRWALQRTGPTRHPCGPQLNGPSGGVCLASVRLEPARPPPPCKNGLLTGTTRISQILHMAKNLHVTLHSVVVKVHKRCASRKLNSTRTSELHLASECRVNRLVVRFSTAQLQSVARKLIRRGYNRALFQEYLPY